MNLYGFQRHDQLNKGFNVSATFGGPPPPDDAEYISSTPLAAQEKETVLHGLNRQRVCEPERQRGQRQF